MAAEVTEDDEWEYEYSTTETEAFYVDLDLCSINGLIRSQNSGDRKSLKRLAKANIDSSSTVPVRKDPNNPSNVHDQENGEDNEDDEDQAHEDVERQNHNSPSQTQMPIEPGLLDEDHVGRLQILDLHTTNPIVSYNGHVYSCAWHDMLGTTMFITKHQEAPFHDPEISTEDYDLIGTSQIKLVGHRAKILPKAGSKKRSRDESEENAEDLDPRNINQYRVPDGKSLGTITRTNPRTNIEIKQQASFLEKLMEVKKSRGETDAVRTFVDRRTVSADARQAQKAKTKTIAKVKDKEKEERAEKEMAEQRLRREIKELNKRVVQGDNDALERLQEIYADMEEAEDEEAEL